MTDASQAVPSAPQPMPADARNRALWQGVVFVLCSLPLVAFLSWLLNRLNMDGGWISLLVFILGLAASAHGLAKLGGAWQRHWDGTGVAALLLMAAGWLLLVIFTSWIVIGLYILTGGGSFSPYGK